MHGNQLGMHGNQLGMHGNPFEVDGALLPLINWCPHISNLALPSSRYLYVFLKHSESF